MPSLLPIGGSATANGLLFFIYSLLPGIFFVALLIAAIFSSIFFYHWVRYGKHIMSVRFVGTIYLGGLLLCFGMMFAGMQ